MILLDHCVAELESDSVMDCYKDEKKCIAHEVVLSVITEHLVVLTDFLAHLDRCCMNWFVSDKGTTKPDSDPEPVAKELDQEWQIFDILNLCLERFIL